MKRAEAIYFGSLYPRAMLLIQVVPLTAALSTKGENRLESDWLWEGGAVVAYACSGLVKKFRERERGEMDGKKEGGKRSSLEGLSGRTLFNNLGSNNNKNAEQGY